MSAMKKNVESGAAKTKATAHDGAKATQKKTGHASHAVTSKASSTKEHKKK